MQLLDGAFGEQFWFSNDPSIIPLYFVALGSLVASIVVPNIIFNAQVKGNSANPDYVPFVLRLALNESVALFGFLIGMQTQYLAMALPFFVISIMRHLRFFPSAKI